MISLLARAVYIMPCPFQIYVIASGFCSNNQSDYLSSWNVPKHDGFLGSPIVYVFESALVFYNVNTHNTFQWKS